MVWVVTQLIIEADANAPVIVLDGGTGFLKAGYAGQVRHNLDS